VQAISVQPTRLLEHRQRRRRTSDRGEAQHLGDRPVEPIEAGPDHRQDRLGKLVVEGRAAAVADQLGEEERVPGGRRVELEGQTRVLAPGLEQVADVARAETVGDDPGEQLVTTEIDREAVELRSRCVGWGAGRPEDHHPSGLLVPEHVLDELQRGGVRPMEIVEHDEERVARRFGAEHLGDALEEEVALHIGRGATGSGLGYQLFELGEQNREMTALAGDPPSRFGRDRAERGADRLDHRLERHDRVGRGPAP
jgi:hypothetical protein